MFSFSGTLFAYPHMYTIPCPITQSLPPPHSPPTGSHSHNYNPYPMKIIVNYPQDKEGWLFIWIFLHTTDTVSDSEREDCGFNFYSGNEYGSGYKTCVLINTACISAMEHACLENWTVREERSALTLYTRYPLPSLRSYGFFITKIGRYLTYLEEHTGQNKHLEKKHGLLHKFYGMCSWI